MSTLHESRTRWRRFERRMRTGIRKVSGGATTVEERPRPNVESATSFLRNRRWLIATAAFTLLLLGVVTYDMRSSRLQSLIFSGTAAGLTYSLGDETSNHIRFPESGPYNERLGYTRIAEFADRLQKGSFVIDSQAVLSSRHERLIDLGLFPFFREKNQAGLEVLDRRGKTLFQAWYPARVYPAFDSIPPAIWQTLLYIENRELLDDAYPYLNPAIEWDRFLRALFLQLFEQVGLGSEGPGASTLATQLEKFRYSPGGMTGSPREKLRQMISASVRAYADGPRTLGTRRRIVTDYLNTLPLGGRPGYGEVIGLAEGLEVWYGSDFDEVNALLWDIEAGQINERTAETYRQVLSLLLATRRPSYLLAEEQGRSELEATTMRYLRLVSQDRVVPPRLAQRAGEVVAMIRSDQAFEPPVSFVGRKAATAVRAELLKLLDVERLYDLDHHDLTVTTTFDVDVQAPITGVLDKLKDRSTVREMGMEGARLLGSQDPGNLYYAVTLYEAGDHANRLLVQTDNFEGPFNINIGSKLELGSTAKLRTLVNYLQVIETLHAEYAGLSRADLRMLPVQSDDRITRWALDYLSSHPQATLEEMLEASMGRRYASSPYERFFTGGGVHVFHNFSASDSSGVYSVRTGFRHSVNLVFIRLMRDIVNYYTARLPDNPASMLENPTDARRQTYLARFADQEGRLFLRRFFDRYRERAGADVWRTFVQTHQPTARRLAWAIRSVHEEIADSSFAALLSKLGYEADALYAKTDARPYDWHDRGYLAGVHPLELWYMSHHFRVPDAAWSDVVSVSEKERQDAYRWLFTSASKRGQDARIRSLIEEEAFGEIYKVWAAAGYPFDRLVPSYATAIGSSADRPQALAELVGIILRRGYRYPTVHVERLHFAKNTPYESMLSFQPPPPTRVLSEETASVLQRALVDVVEHGTAIRIRNAVTGADGRPVAIGGKTGTGDNRVKLYDSKGRVRGGEVRSRTSTFVFFIGDRLFGTVTAYVTGADAERYHFTSSLPVQLLKELQSEMQPLMQP